MKKILLFSFVTLVTLVIFAILLFFINKDSAKGALQVTSQPQSTVYLNGKNIGDTPLADNQIASGEYTIRLVPKEGEHQAFENRIKINPRVLTVIDRTFEQNSSSEGSIITLSKLDKKDSELLVISFPEKAQLFLDNSPIGETPNLLKNVTESDHEIRLGKVGYKEKVARIRTVKGFKLEALIFLGINPDLTSQPKADQPRAETPSAKVSISKILILSTPTGFLRVRSGPSVSFSQISQVLPGEEYEFIKEEEGWFEIKLKDGKTGWVSSQYSRKE